MRLLLVVVCSFLAVACGSSAPDVPPLPERPAPDGATTFSPRPDILGAHPVPVGSWSKLADDRIELHFETGTPECFGVNGTVVETDETVTVELLGGTLPEARDRVCIMVAVAGVLEVPLQAPLADRVVTTS